mmetsp:Transcript_115389/g.368196  ORF Transcript_115389/g.368196 Transcript_115389/m.368196 type:complete len:213 (-) Transcript_115389:265-903(-)
MPTSTPTSQWRRMASGSPTPLSSMTRWWKGAAPMRLTSSWTEATRSSEAVQQTQPLESSATSMAPPRSYLRTSCESMFTAATSLTTTPRRTPSWFSRMCFSRDVLPEPRKPVRRVTGVRSTSFILRRRSSVLLKSRIVVVGVSSWSGSSALCENPRRASPAAAARDRPRPGPLRKRVRQCCCCCCCYSAGVARSLCWPPRPSALARSTPVQC